MQQRIQRQPSLLIFLTLLLVVTVTIAEMLLLHTVNNYSYLPAHFGSTGAVSSIITDTGFFPKEDFLQDSQYLGQLRHDIRYPIISIFISTISVVCNLPRFSQELYMVYYAMIVLCLFFGFFLYIKRLSQGYAAGYTIMSISLIYGLLVNYQFKPYLINAPVTWFLSLLIIYIVFFYNHNPRLSMLVMIFLLITILTYFTPSLFLLLFLFTLLVFERFWGVSSNVTPYLCLFYLSAFFGYTFYRAGWRFSSLIVYAREIFTYELNLSFWDPVGAVSSDLSEIISSTSYSNKICTAVLIFISLLPMFGYSMKLIHSVLIGQSRLDKTSVPTISIFVFGFLTYIAGSQRFTEWGSIYSNAVFPKFFPQKRWVVYTFVVMLMVLSVFSGWMYIFNENNAINYIKNHEAVTASWSSSHFCDQLLFTDFRTSAPFIVLGHYKTVGPVEYDKEMIDSLYYRYENSTYLTDTYAPNNKKIWYFYVSEEMTKDLPGIRLYDRTIKGIPLTTYNAYLYDEKLDFIYNNGGSRVFYLV